MPAPRVKSTADRLLSFRERLARHYAALRNPKMKKIPKPDALEFDRSGQAMARVVELQEMEKHEAALAADESFKRLGYKT